MSLKFDRHAEMGCLKRLHALTEYKIGFTDDSKGIDHLCLELSRPRIVHYYIVLILGSFRRCAAVVWFFSFAFLL